MQNQTLINQWIFSGWPIYIYIYMRSQITEIMFGLSTNSVIVSPCLMVDRAIYPKAGLAGCLEPIWWKPMEFHMEFNNYRAVPIGTVR